MTQAKDTLETAEPTGAVGTIDPAVKQSVKIDLTGEDIATKATKSTTRARKGTATKTKTAAQKKAAAAKVKATKAEKAKATKATKDEETKATKGKTTRRRTAQTKKKHYTEDSIRLYLQEIGRIRLLRAEEEIELARKIADLLELERIYDEIDDQLENEPTDTDWANAVDMPLPAFQRRLHLGRRAKDKMVQSNLRLVRSEERRVGKECLL